MELSLVFEFCWLFFAFADDINADLIEISNCKEATKENGVKLYKKICELVQFHSNVKELRSI